MDVADERNAWFQGCATGERNRTCYRFQATQVVASGEDCHQQWKRDERWAPCEDAAGTHGCRAALSATLLCNHGLPTELQGHSTRAFPIYASCQACAKEGQAVVSTSGRGGLAVFSIDWPEFLRGVCTRRTGLTGSPTHALRLPELWAARQNLRSAFETELSSEHLTVAWSTPAGAAWFLAYRHSLRPMDLCRRTDEH